MLGYIKVDSTTHVIHYDRGKVAREGQGLAFLYFKPTSTIVAVPTSSVDVPFIFNEITADFQPVTLQGQITYRIFDPRKIAANLNFTLAPDAKTYVSEDPQKVGQRIVNYCQVLTRPEVQALPLKTALMATQPITAAVSAALQASPAFQELGVQILTFALLAIRPTPEMAKAVEAEAREELQKRSDQAISARRYDAVEQERRIKENELQTELVVQLRRQELAKSQLEAEIAREQQRAQFIDARVDNAKKEADMQAYALHSTFKPLQALDPASLEVLAATRTDPRVAIAMAIRELADNASKIGNLNISPDLLTSLMQDGGARM